MTTQLLLISHDSRRGTAIGQRVAGQAGIGVTVATSFEDAHRKLDRATFDTVYVDDAPDGRDVRSIALAVRDLRPRVRLIVARSEDASPESEMYTTWGVDDVIPRLDDDEPAVLVLVDVLGRTSPRATETDMCIGRSVQQMTMEQTLANACEGRGNIVLCRGGRGSGKTRGARWLAGRVLHRGGIVLGAAAQEGARIRTCGLLGDVFDQLVEQDPESRSYAIEILKRRPEYVVLVPRLRDSAPAGNGNGRVPDPEALRRGAETLLRNAASRRLVLITLDDVHQADRYSLELMRRLASTIGRLRVVAFVAYRAEDLSSGPVADVLRGMTELSSTVTLDLPPLSGAHVAEFLRRSWGRKPTDDEVALARAMTGGNPRDLTTFARREHGTMEDSGSLERSLLGQLDRIPELDREGLLIASVIGMEFEPALLADVWNGDRRKHETLDIDGLLRDLRERHLIREVPGTTRCAFVHPALRDAVYARCSNARRLHARVAVAMARMPATRSNGQAGIVADHFLRADSPHLARQTLEAVDAAVALACRQHEYGVAIGLLRRLLDGRVLAHPEGQRCDRLCQLARLLWRRGNGPEAGARAMEALAIARHHRDPFRVASAALAWAARGRGFGTAWPQADLVRALEEALDSTAASDVVLEARLAAMLADELRFVSRERAEHFAERARSAARRSNDPAVLAEVASYLQWQRWCTIDAADRSGLMDEFGADRHEPYRRFDIAFARVWIAYERGEPHIERLTDACSRIAAEIGDPYLLWLVGLAELCLQTGRTNSPLDEPRLSERLEQVRQLGIEAHNPQMAGLYFAADLAIAWFLWGRLADRGRLLSSLRKPFPDLGPFIHAILGMTYAYDGRLDEARHELSLVSLESLPKDETWLVSKCVLAEAYAEIGDRAQAARLYDVLLPLQGRIVIIAPVAVLLPVDYHLGRLACAMGQPQLGRRHFEAALKLETPLRRPGAIACISLGMAEALRGHGAVVDDEHLQELLRSVVDTCDRLGLQALRRRVARLAAGAGAARTTPHTAPIPGRLSRDGAIWWFQLGAGPLITLKHALGAVVLSMILLAPREGVTAAALCAALNNRGPQAPSHGAMGKLDAGVYEPADPRVLESIREVSRQLEIAEETKSPDVGRLRELLRQLEAQLHSARRCLARRPENRIRKLVNRTLAQIAQSDPAAAQHLRNHVKIGWICRYERELEHPVDWTVTPGGVK